MASLPVTGAYNDVNSGLAYALGNMYREKFVIPTSEVTSVLLAAFYLQFAELKDAWVILLQCTHVLSKPKLLHFAFGVAKRNVYWSCPSVCLCVCLSLAACLHYCAYPDVTWGNGMGVPPSCALLGGFAISARVSLLWQHTRLIWYVNDDASSHCMVGLLSDL